MHLKPSALGWLVGLLPALASGTLVASAQVILNEVLADNRRAIEHGGEHPDFVELHNPTGASVNLEGMGLTDDPAQPRKFSFPAGTRIPAAAHLMVWCGGNPAGPGLRADFGLSNRGERVWLFAADGLTVLDDVAFGAQIADFSIGRVTGPSGPWELTVVTPGKVNVAADLGPASALKLNEWMARPATGDDWLELFNPGSLPVALGRLVLSDRGAGTPDNRALEDLSFIAALGFVQLWASGTEEADPGHLDFRLGASGETLTLYAGDRLTVIDRVRYGAQTSSVSQGRAPDGGETLVFFPETAATPGAANFSPLDEVVFSEVLTHTDPPLEDAIELHNPTATAVEVSHWWLSDAASAPRKYRIPAGTTIAPDGYAVFYQNQFGAGAQGFALNSVTGEELFLSEGDAAGNLTGRQILVAFGALRNGVSVGRVQTSVGVDFVPLEHRTFGIDQPGSLPEFRQGRGAANAPPRVGPLVITEIHFSPSTEAAGIDGGDEEFIELYNPTTERVLLYDPAYPTNAWRVRQGVSFDFAPGLILPAGGHLVIVGFDPRQEPARRTAFQARHSMSSETPILGPFAGNLSDSGETVELLLPDKPEGLDDPEPGRVPYEQVERIAYAVGLPWPGGAVGTGASLQRIHPLAYGNEPTNWSVATPTPGRLPSVDRDQDGLPDDWETRFGLDPQDARDAEMDSDLDGARNRDEFHAGTSPKDPASALKVRIADVAPLGIRVAFPAVAGRTYGLEQRGFEGDGTWVRVATSLPVPEDQSLELTAPRTSTPGGWLRIVVLPPPAT